MRVFVRLGDYSKLSKDCYISRILIDTKISKQLFRNTYALVAVPGLHDFHRLREIVT